METADPARVIETMSRRADLLRALRDGPKSKRALVAALPISRSTVDRAVRQLETSGLVTRESGAVGLSFVGRVALRAFDEFYDGLAGLQRASEIIGPIPPDASIDLRVFAGADFVRAEAHAPHQPVQGVKDFLGGAERIRGVASAVLPDYVAEYSRQIIEEGTTVELVVSDRVLETLLTEYQTPLESALATGRFELCVVEQSPPFSTIIAYRESAELGVVVYGDSGATGLIRNSGSDALRWGEAWVDEWIERATPLDGPDEVAT